MKTKIFALALVLFGSSLSWAKVSDFNNLISENIKAQDNLHRDVKGSVNLVKQELRAKAAEGKITVVETGGTYYNSPSRKMKFGKEVKHYRPSNQKQMDRIATEFSEAEQDF